MHKIRKGQSGLSFMSGVTPSPPSTITQSIPGLQYFNFKFQLPSDSNVAMQTLGPNAMSTDSLQDTINRIVPQYSLQNPTEQQGQDFSFQLSSPESMLKQSIRNQSYVEPRQQNNNGLFTSNNMQQVGTVADSLDALIPKTGQSDLTTGLNSFYDQLSNKVGPIAGGIMKAAGLVSDGLTALGVGTDQMTTTDKILDSKFLKATPIGLVNSVFGKKADTIYKNDQAFEQVGSSYTGTNAFVDDAVKKSGKKYGLFSSGARKKANEQIGEANRQQNIVSDIADEATDRFNIRNSIAAINGNRMAYYLQGGYDQSSIRVGKSGMSIDLIKRAKEIVSDSKKQKVDKHKNGGQLSHSTEILLVEPELIQGAIDIFKEGGSINVIPDGALHARKHNMDMEGITPKGIPVVSDKEDGKVEQQAEIEKEEIIFRLEVTKKLEELEKKFYNDDTSQKEKDDLALEAGKLLVNEILYNTQDNTNNLL